MLKRPAAVWAFLLTLAASASAASAQQVFDQGDGSSTGLDFDFQNSTTTIQANWSGIQVEAPGFEWAIGTTSGGQDVQAFTNVGFAPGAVNSGLGLTAGSIYYVTVRGVYMGTPFEHRSDGITVFKAPTANGGLAPLLTGTAAFTVTFGLQMQGIAFYEWDFDQPLGSDGTISSPEFTGTASGNAQYTYQTPESYEATWRITHAGGEVKAAWFTVIVTPSPQAPSVGIIAVPPTGPAPLTVNFTVPATTADGTISAVLWDFDGDGLTDASSASTLSISHTFGSIGLFQTKVTILDGQGNQAFAKQAVDVLDPGPSYDPPGISIGGFGPAPCPTGIPFTVTFTVDAGPQGGGVITSVEIDFDGDGNVDRILTPGVPGPITVNERFQFDTPGTRPVVITARDSEGFSRTTGRAGVVLTVEAAPGVNRCWIVQPVTGARVWGDHLSVLAQAAPETSVEDITFEFRVSPAGPWTTIGTATPSPDGFFGAYWDVTGLTQGALYELKATAKFLGGAVVDSTAVMPILVTVQEGAPPIPMPPYYEEFSGSPFTKIQLVTVNPNLQTIGSILNNITVQIPAGAVGSYEQMRLERRAEALQTVSARLQGLKLVHRRKLSFGGNTPLQKPGKVSMYVGPSGPILPDGTDLNKAQLKVYRFEPSRSRWEPLLNPSFNPAKLLVQAQTVSGGDLAVVVDEPSGGSGESSGDCGLGIEGALVCLLFMLRRRR